MRRFIHKLAIGLALMGPLFGVAAPTLAATTPSGTGQGLEISPPVVEINASPGQSVVANIKLRNVTDVDLVARGKIDDFGAKGEDGEPNILLDEKEAGRYSLKFWVPSVPSLSLAPKEAKTAVVTINVPADAEPGGHYGVARFTALPPGVEGTGLSLNASIGTLILLNVAGDARQSAKVIEFYAAHDGRRGGFFEYGPVDFTARIKNDGTVHVKPTGKLEISNMLGKVIKSINFNDPPKNVLPDSVRRFDATLGSRWLIGRYTAHLTYTYGSQNTTGEAELHFWVIPYRALALLLLAVLLAYYLLRGALRRYNAGVIRRANRK